MKRRLIFLKLHFSRLFAYVSLVVAKALAICGGVPSGYFAWASAAILLIDVLINFYAIAIVIVVVSRMC
jgi:hypothetical protein